MKYAYAFEVKSSYCHEEKQEKQLIADLDYLTDIFHIKKDRIELFKVTGRYPNYDIIHFKS